MDLLRQVKSQEQTINKEHEMIFTDEYLMKLNEVNTAVTESDQEMAIFKQVAENNGFKQRVSDISPSTACDSQDDDRNLSISFLNAYAASPSFD